jgi:UDP-2,4-diacetamido-2,4,6-trideoxy-beta-L-altropyranose hydrolase
MSDDIAIRVDANPEMGLGHLLRCLALAQGLLAERVNLKVVFLMSLESEALALSRADWIGEIMVLPQNLGLDQEPNWVAQYCQINQVKAIVLDGYQFDSDYRQNLAKTTTLLKVVFDDNNNSGPLFADIVINGASSAAQLGYALSAPKATFCIGEQYRILRQEFCQQQYNLPWSKRDKLTLVMGGSDPRNMTLQILQGLAKLGFHDEITVVTGSAYQHTRELKQTIQHSMLLIKHIENCQKMAALFGQSRVVISAPGGPPFELFACPTPALLLVVADNQLNATQEASKQGWCESIDVRCDSNLQQVITRLSFLWSEPKLLNSMYQHAKQWSDTQGSSRVAKEILSSLSENRHG